ncbi:MAG: transposase, partial [Lachnospiraceae bacterium]|nr:transposase [Lachnospiraceae bacterium]
SEISLARWNIELSFRDLKHTIGTLNFHSRKRKYIEQELWCRLILYNFCSIIIVHTPVKADGKKYIYQVNFSMAMKICIAFLRDENSPPDTESLIRRYILPIRPERNYARQHRIQHPASFAYRFV